MRRTSVVFGLAAFLAAGAMAIAQGTNQLKTNLIGFEEVPSVSTTASGNFEARISPRELDIDWELSYEGLEGAVQQAHIHVAQGGVNGGISVWLCGNPSATISPPAGTQTCPTSPATISGVLTAANVVGPTGQGVAAGEWEELIAAIRAGKAYANVHSARFPGGEIRGQLPHGLHP